MNDKKASDGIYIGCLPNTKTVMIRNFQDKLLCEQQQIELLQKEFEMDWSIYLLDVIDILKFFKVNMNCMKFTVGVDRLMVGEDGHTWIVFADRDVKL